MTEEERRLFERESSSEIGGWPEYRRLVLAELERINISISVLNVKIDEHIIRDIAKLRSEVEMLKVKSGVWGAAAAVLVTLGVILINILTGLKLAH